MGYGTVFRWFCTGCEKWILDAINSGKPYREAFEELKKNRKIYSDKIQSVKADNINVDDYLWNEFSKNHKIEAGKNYEGH